MRSESEGQARENTDAWVQNEGDGAEEATKEVMYSLVLLHLDVYTRPFVR